MQHRRRALTAAAAVALATAGVSLPAASATTAPATAGSPAYTVNVTGLGTFNYPDDTPASAYIDKDGSFHFQESYSLYAKTDPRTWEFYQGTNFTDATLDSALTNSVNPANPQDSNLDTTWRCNNSPTGVTSTYMNNGTGYYSQKNYCDLLGTWVDPDTGDWYGLVHNEFTPQPFGDGLHYDAIDYAVSHDRGKTWSIQGHAITSPYSTTRGDTAAFPNQTYDYGDGDQRLYVDAASGYFYVYYGSRVINKPGSKGPTVALAHVARAPISGKMATGTWQKWYDGAWTQPGVGGQESNMVPSDAGNPDGYTAPAKDYNPKNAGSTQAQITAGVLPTKSPLVYMNITYDAYLGLYIGTPETVGQTGSEPQQVYVTKDLSTQKWTLIGDTGSLTWGSWYRWFVDPANNWSPNIVGKNLQVYCSIACSGNDGQIVNLAIGTSNPAAPVVSGRNYVINAGDGQVLAQVAGSSAVTSQSGSTGWALDAWSFSSLGDGSYTIVNASTGAALGVDASQTAQRAWGTKPTATTVGASGPSVGQQWFILPDTANPGSLRLINRYSGLALAMSSNTSRLAETTPPRSWTDTSGTAVGGGRQVAEQTLSLTPAHPTQGPEQVFVTDPGNQTGATGTAVAGVQVTAADSKGKALTYSATGLPPGLSISTSGLITGTPTAGGTSTVTVTATSGHATASTTFTWAVAVNLAGTHTVTTSGVVLEPPKGSTNAGDQLVTAPATGAANEKWTFTRQSDGSYAISNAANGMCMDDNGGSTAPGTAAIQWQCSGASNQSWTAAVQTDGQYTLTNEHTGLVLTTASTAADAAVTQEADTGSALQRWSVQ
jgi:hypothetical protein